MNIRKNYKRHALISGVLSLILIVGSLSTRVERNPVLILGILAFLWFVYVMLRYHRCPKCKKYLPLLDFRAANCRYCGSSLDELETDWLKCPSCGKSNHRFDVNKREIRFCCYCGHPLDNHIRN